MCLITYAPKKSLLNMQELEAGQDNNPHGFGIVFAANGRLRYCKKLADFKVFKAGLALVPEDVPLMIHFRWATHGEKSKENIHPFRILSTVSGDPIDIAMSHNGTISHAYQSNSPKSDTLLYVENILQPLIKMNPDIIFEKAFQTLIERDIGRGSKLCFLRGDGKVAFYNKDQGHVPKDNPEIWYSNDYSLRSAYRSTRSSGYRGAQDHWDGYGFWKGNEWIPRTNSNHISDVRNIHNSTSSNSDKTILKTDPSSSPVKTKLDFFEYEKDVPAEISALLKPGEFLIANTFENKVSLLGYGWTKKGSFLEHNEKVGALHKAWKLGVPIKTEDSTSTAGKEEPKPEPTTDKNTVQAVLNLVPKQELSEQDKELAESMERKFTAANFRMLSERELGDWILKYPDEASEWLSQNGVHGSAKGILNYMQHVPGAIDEVTTFMFKKTRGHSTKEVIVPKEEEERKAS